MVLAGKLSSEVKIKANADKFYHIFASQLHNIENVCGKIHAGKLHEGDDWHHVDTVKHWTYVIDGKVHTCNESVEVDGENKKVTYKLFGGDIGKDYKTFLIILEVIDNGDSHASVKWTIEYEKLNEEVDPPTGYIEYLNHCTRDADSHVGQANANP